jgi:hypothetical protein
MIGAVPDQEALMRKAVTTMAVLGGLLLASPAPAHTIDVRSAADAVKQAASTLGEVDKAKCWRPVIGARLARHRSICVAWWVHTETGQSCTIFYEVRTGRHPSRRPVVIQTYQPWCASAPRDLPIDVQGPSGGVAAPSS